MTYDEISADLRRAGWSRGVTSDRGQFDDIRAERARAEASSCQACGTVGLSYAPFTNDRRDHCGIAYCPACFTAVEL